MESNKIIFEMFTRFTNIINGIKSLGKVYTNVKTMRKILRRLSRNWGPKVIAIEEAKDLIKMGLKELFGSFMTHEITLKPMRRSIKAKRREKFLLKWHLFK